MTTRSRRQGRKAGKPSAKGKLAGKTVAFAGKFGYRDMFLPRLQSAVGAEGGTVVEVTAAVPDYLIAGEGRGGNPPAIVAKVQKKYPAVQVLSEGEFCRLLLPSREELVAELPSGPNDYDRWDLLEDLARKAAATIDLSGIDLRRQNLYGAKLVIADLDGADLRNASAHYAHFGDLKGVQFDGADLHKAHFLDTEDCTFSGANLKEAWLGRVGFGQANRYQRCDFTRANLQQVRGTDCQFTECVFEQADLSDANMERSDFSGAKLTGANLSRAHCANSKLEGADLTGAVLFRADLRNASLANADLRKADLREAALGGADLTGARVDGADFAGTILTGAKTGGLDLSQVSNVSPPAARQPGPHLRALAQAAASAKDFRTSAEVELGQGEHVTLYLSSIKTGYGASLSARSHYQRDDVEARDLIDAPTFEQGMLNLADRWPGSTLRLDTVQARGSPTVRGQKLLNLALAAWAEAFGLEAAAPEDLQQKKADQHAEVQKLRETMLAELRGGAAGVKKWNARSTHEHEKIGVLRDLDLKGARLSGVRMERLDLQGCAFEGATLKKARLWSCQLQRTNFAGANLEGANLDHSACENASFEGARLVRCHMSMAYLNQANLRGADLTGATLVYAKLLGADLTKARLDRVNLRKACYDANTKFPAGFVPPEEMEFVGPPPEVAARVRPAPPGSMDFPTFIEQLGYTIEPSRLSKAAAMLKADRFQLFADVKDDGVVGIVKSQSNPDLVYSCRLTSNGRFGCCTQNLKPCGGLHGSLCKHLLVLVVGLAKAGRLDPATVDGWIDASAKQKPELDRDVMSETLLRYKGAEAGEVDWRPTETLPEDYYSL